MRLVSYHGSLVEHYGVYAIVADCGPYVPPEAQRYHLANPFSGKVLLNAGAQSVTPIR